jgi:hypothetical protein
MLHGLPLLDGQHPAVDVFCKQSEELSMSASLISLA